VKFQPDFELHGRVLFLEMSAICDHAFQS
jgi:hypothetical protein